MTRYFMGIDGGGSTVRTVVVSPDLDICGQSIGTTANPSIVGHEAAAHTIQTAIRASLDSAGLSPDAITAVGIGVAGAEARHSEMWLRETVAGVLPSANVAPSSDGEIALVGAHGERRGVLILAGTGSVLYGINSTGEGLMLGGWGYLLGDEGSGYWLVSQALRAVALHDDGIGRETTLTTALLGAMGLNSARELVGWMYHQNGVRSTREVAAFAPYVLDAAEAGDQLAKEIIFAGADALAKAARTVLFRLNMERLPIAFAGGLLDNPNPLSLTLCECLGLETLPQAKYPPVIGAAILARMTDG